MWYETDSPKLLYKQYNRERILIISSASKVVFLSCGCGDLCAEGK